MKNILEFLSDLRENNTREWMEKNKPQYLDAKKSFEEMVEVLISQISEFDSSIAGIKAKDCTFRLHRDVRFSNNKLPYKTNMGAFIGSNGKKSVNGGYYFHLEAGKSMLAGGVYMPPADVIKKLRQEIDYNPADLVKYIESDSFKKYFGAFEGDALKSAPRGYPVDHPNIELLRLKSFIVVHKVSDKELLSQGFIKKTTDVFHAAKPLNDYIRLAVSV